MEAKEMFEVLGYFIEEENEHRIIYTLVKDNDCSIMFYLEDKEVIFEKKEWCDYNITMEELEAINKQCKELGFFDEE